MPGKSKFKKDERLGYLLKAAQQALRNKMDGALGRCGLTTSQYSVLAALERISFPSNADLARECFVTAQTMIRIVRNLEDERLIRKFEHPTKGKVIGIEITNKGRKSLNAAHQTVAEVEMILRLGVSPSEQSMIVTNLKKMIANLSNPDADENLVD